MPFENAWTEKQSKNITTTDYNGRKRPQINKHEFNFFLIFFHFLPLIPFHPPSPSFISYVIRICPRTQMGLLLLGGLMNKYGKFSFFNEWREKERKICFHFSHENLGSPAVEIYENIFEKWYGKLDTWKVSLGRGSSSDMFEIIKNNFLRALFSITMRVYWQSLFD